MFELQIHRTFNPSKVHTGNHVISKTEQITLNETMEKSIPNITGTVDNDNAFCYHGNISPKLDLYTGVLYIIT